MKQLIITDIHGRNPSYIIEEMKKSRGIERGICLGDIESSEITAYLLNLGEEKMKVVPGNHDYPYMWDCCKILNGKEVNRKNKPDFIIGSLEEYWSEVDRWCDNMVLRNFAKKIIDSKSEDRFQYEFSTKFGKIVGIHASIFDNYDSLDESDERFDGYPRPYQMWARMHTAMGSVNHETLKGTFEIMTSSSPIWLMLRGHDWSQRLYSLNKDTRLSDYKMEWNPSVNSLEFNLSPDACYIVSFGSYQQGQYGILDVENKALEFHNPERGSSWGS